MNAIVLHGCDLVDGQGTAPRHKVDIVVEGDTIREIVPPRPAEHVRAGDRDRRRRAACS